MSNPKGMTHLVNSKCMKVYNTFQTYLEVSLQHIHLAYETFVNIYDISRGSLYLCYSVESQVYILSKDSIIEVLRPNDRGLTNTLKGQVVNAKRVLKETLFSHGYRCFFFLVLQIDINFSSKTPDKSLNQLMFDEYLSI